MTASIGTSIEDWWFRLISTLTILAGSTSVGAVSFVVNGSTFGVQNISKYNQSSVYLEKSSLLTNGAILLDQPNLSSFLTHRDDSGLLFIDVSLAGFDYSIDVAENLYMSGQTSFSSGDAANITVRGCVDLSGDLVVKFGTFVPNMTLFRSTCQVRLSASNCISFELIILFKCLDWWFFIYSCWGWPGNRILPCLIEGPSITTVPPPRTIPHHHHHHLQLPWMSMPSPDLAIVARYIMFTLAECPRNIATQLGESYILIMIIAMILSLLAWSSGSVITCLNLCRELLVLDLSGNRISIC